MTDTLELAYRATTADELEMARTLLLQRMTAPPEQWPERHPEELGLLEQIEFSLALLGQRPALDEPEPVVEELETVADGATLPADSTEAGLRGQLE